MIRHQAVVVALVCLMCLAAAADVKYTMEMQTGPGMPSLSTTVYVKGQLERRDMTMPGMGQISTITNCATRQTTMVNAKCSVYWIVGSEGGAPAAASGAGPARKGGVVKVINEIRDTGERQTMLGQQARHLLLKTRLEAGPGACISGQTEMDMDMWVINVAGFSPDCQKFGEPPASPQAGGCRDTYEVVNRGATAAMGLPVKQTFTTTVDGQRHSMTMEVKELSTQTLDASLFAPPAGAKQAASAQEVYTCGMGPMMAGGGMQAQMAEAMKRAREQQAREQQEQPAQPRPPTPYAVGEVGSRGAGRGGVILIGVVTTDKSGKAPPDRLTSQIIEQIGNAQGFQGVPIEARDPAAIEKEAADKKCQFLLYGDVAEAKTTMPKLGGLLGRATGRGGSVEPTQSIRAEYRLTLVQPFDQQVARDALSQSEQAPSMEPVAGNLATKIAERAVSDARRWKQQNK